VGRLASLSEFRLARDPSELLTIGRHDPLDTAHQAKGDGGQGGKGQPAYSKPSHSAIHQSRTLHTRKLTALFRPQTAALGDP
jgi:hypothetical protein